MIDGTRKTIVSDVIDDYAIFISQRLNEHLDLDAAPDVSRLIEDERGVDDTQLTDEAISHAQTDTQL